MAPKSQNNNSSFLETSLTLGGPRIIPFQWVKVISSSFSRPQLTVPSPVPFCPSSSSSSKRKLRGTTIKIRQLRRVILAWISPEFKAAKLTGKLAKQSSKEELFPNLRWDPPSWISNHTNWRWGLETSKISGNRYLFAGSSCRTELGSDPLNARKIYKQDYRSPVYGSCPKNILTTFKLNFQLKRICHSRTFQLRLSLAGGHRGLWPRDKQCTGSNWSAAGRADWT